MRLRNHHGHEIYERNASSGESESDEGDADYDADDGEGGTDSDGGVEEDLDEEGQWLAEGDRWVAASIGGKVDAYVDVPGEERRIHKATLVAHKNNDPTCSVERLLRVRNATEAREQRAPTGEAVSVGDVVAYGGAGDDRWSAGVVRSMSKRDGSKRIKYRDPVSVDEPNMALLVSPLVKKAGQARHAREIDGGEVVMVLANCAEDSVELSEVQRVMGGGRSTEPDIGGGPTNAKEWIFSKGETTWFMRYPKRNYDNSIAKWQ